MDSDLSKGYKSRKISIFGKDYEISHRNNRVINNNFSIYFGVSIYMCKQFFIKAVLFRKILIISGFIMMGYLLYWSHIDNNIISCINDYESCIYNITNCVNLEYNNKYNCIKQNYNKELTNSSLYNFMNMIYLFIQSIILLYLIAVICDKLSIIINMTIKIYKENVPDIDSII